MLKLKYISWLYNYIYFFLAHSCRSKLFYYHTTWCHPDANSFSSVSGSSSSSCCFRKFFFFLPLSPLACSLEIKPYLDQLYIGLKKKINIMCIVENKWKLEILLHYYLHLLVYSAITKTPWLVVQVKQHAQNFKHIWRVCLYIPSSELALVVSVENQDCFPHYSWFILCHYSSA